MKYLILILFFASCAPIAQRKSRPAKPRPAKPFNPINSTFRHVRYQDCLVKLNKEGIRQSLLLPLCNAAHGERR